MASVWSPADWETEIHREAEELRSLEDEDIVEDEDATDGGGDLEDNFTGWLFLRIKESKVYRGKL